MASGPKQGLMHAGQSVLACVCTPVLSILTPFHSPGGTVPRRHQRKLGFTLNVANTSEACFRALGRYFKSGNVHGSLKIRAPHPCPFFSHTNISVLARRCSNPKPRNPPAHPKHTGTGEENLPDSRRLFHCDPTNLFHHAFPHKN